MFYTKTMFLLGLCKRYLRLAGSLFPSKASKLSRQMRLNQVNHPQKNVEITRLEPRRHHLSTPPPAPALMPLCGLEPQEPWKTWKPWAGWKGPLVARQQPWSQWPAWDLSPGSAAPPGGHGFLVVLVKIHPTFEQKTLKEWHAISFCPAAYPPTPLRLRSLLGASLISLLWETFHQLEQPRDGVLLRL